MTDLLEDHIKLLRDHGYVVTPPPHPFVTGSRVLVECEVVQYVGCGPDGEHRWSVKRPGAAAMSGSMNVPAKALRPAKGVGE